MERHTLSRIDGVYEARPSPRMNKSPLWSDMTKVPRDFIRRDVTSMRIQAASPRRVHVFFLDADGRVVAEHSLAGRVSKGAFITQRRFVYENYWAFANIFSIERLWLVAHADGRLLVFPDESVMILLGIFPTPPQSGPPSSARWRSFSRLDQAGEAD